MYKDKTTSEYLDDLAARRPSPGGGSAAAFCAAIGVSLMSMVANYTVGNPKYGDSQEPLADMLVSIVLARKEFERLVDADAETYDLLSKAVKGLPNGSEALEICYKNAAQVPFDICIVSAECLKLCESLARLGNKNLVTDTAIAVIILEGAFFSAKYNVYINLKYIKDMAYIERMHKVLGLLEKSIPKLREDILEICENVIK